MVSGRERRGHQHEDSALFSHCPLLHILCRVRALAWRAREGMCCQATGGRDATGASGVRAGAPFGGSCSPETGGSLQGTVGSWHSAVGVSCRELRVWAEGEVHYDSTQRRAPICSGAACDTAHTDMRAAPLSLHVDQSLPDSPSLAFLFLVPSASHPAWCLLSALP